MSENDPRGGAPRLRRVLGLVFGLAVVVGGVIGSGIMRAPGVVALGLHSVPLTLLLWAAGGGMAMVSAMPLVEAGADAPRRHSPTSRPSSRAPQPRPGRRRDRCSQHDRCQCLRISGSPRGTTTTWPVPERMVC